MKNPLPGKHAEESVNDLTSEGNTHLNSQRLKQCQEEGQHLIRHICERKFNLDDQMSL